MSNLQSNTFRAMVIDLARLYKDECKEYFEPSLLHDVLVAVHEGALKTDTTKFEVVLDPFDITFFSENDGMLLKIYQTPRDEADACFKSNGVEQFVLMPASLVESSNSFVLPIFSACHKVRLTNLYYVEIYKSDKKMAMVFHRSNENSLVVMFFLDSCSEVFSKPMV